MSVEVRPLGVRCNLHCHYCYQNPERDAGNVASSYKLELMKRAVEAEGGGPFTLFGGEALLLPLEDLEELWAWGMERYGRNYLQTNGTLITGRHIELFKKYFVTVGLSLDGPGELNDARWHGSVERTRLSTAKAQAAIEWLCREGMAPCVITTLNRSNATAEKLPALMDWIVALDETGVKNMRLHLLESESAEIREKFGLSDEENVAAMLALANLQTRLKGIMFDVFADMALMLLGRDTEASCIWKGCDPYTTRAVRGVEGHGQRSNCGRTNKEGVDFVKSSAEGFERYVALYQTPQSAGGCSGCRFFLMCKGQCPGTAIDGDWRNRTEHCRVWMTLFSLLEGEMLAAGERPLSVDDRRGTLERELMTAWSAGRNPTIAQVLKQAEADGKFQAA